MCTVILYQWFDYVLRAGPKPELLQDVVNYEVPGANVWSMIARKTTRPL